MNMGAWEWKDVLFHVFGRERERGREIVRARKTRVERWKSFEWS